MDGPDNKQGNNPKSFVVTFVILLVLIVGAFIFMRLAGQ
jgi:hypothetical protein